MPEPSENPRPHGTETTSDRPLSNVRLLGWVAFWSGMAQEMVYPLLPTFLVVALAASRTSLGAIEGLLAVGVTIARLVTGRRVDRGDSPRRLTRISYAISLISRPLMAVATAVPMVGVLRVADGFGKGGKDAPRDFLVAADTEDTTAGRAFGLQRMLDTLGSVAGPLAVAGVLFAIGHGETGLRIAFGLSVIPAIGAAMCLRRVHDTAPVVHDPDHAKIPLGKPFVALAIAVGVFGLANSSDTLLLLRAQSAGLSAGELAVLYAGFNLTYAMLAIPLGAFADRHGRRPMLIVAWISYALVYAGFAYAGAAWQVIVLFLAYGIYYAASEGTLKAWIRALVPPERRGGAYGLLAATGGFLTLPASVAAGWLWDHHGPGPAFAMGAILSGVAVLVVVLSPRCVAQTTDPEPRNCNQSATRPVDHGGRWRCMVVR